MIAMREVQFEDDGQVPGVAIAVGYVLVLTSIAMLVMYVDHIGRSLRVSSLIELVGNDTRRLLDKHYPDRLVADKLEPHLLNAPMSGVLTGIDCDRLVEIARAGGCVLYVVPALGEFVPTGAPLIRIDGEVGSVDREAVLTALTSGLERTLDEDIAYGFRMLVDMAERSLSDSPFLDPTTAVQAIDRLHDGLRQLAGRAIPDGRHYDSTGQLRVTTRVMQWDAYVHLAFDEIRLAGAGSPQVTRRLVAAMDDLRSVAPPERQFALNEQLELLRTAVRDLPRHEHDKALALRRDPQGIGVAIGETNAPSS